MPTKFDWNIAQPLDQIMDTESGSPPDGPRLIEQLDIQLNLTKQGGSRHTNDVFQPKTYTIRIEKGNFITPSDAAADVDDELTKRFALRLAFDKSPYAKRDGDDKNAWKYFAAREIAELQKRHGYPFWRCTIC